MESQPNAPYRVFVSSRTPNAELTAAFHDPTILSRSTSFIQRHCQFAIDPKTAHAEQRALLIRFEMNTLGVLSLLLFGLVVCFGLGVLVSFLTQRLDLGIAVS